MLSFFQNKRAYILIEAILGVLIFSIFVVAFFSGMIRMREVPFFAGNRDRAILIAQEGLEAVRNIASDDFSNLVDGEYGLAVNSNQWEFSGTSETIDDYYTRQIIISPIDEYTKQVDSVITWNQTDARTGEISLTTYFTNYNLEGLVLDCDWSELSVPSYIDLDGDQDVYKSQIQNSYAYSILKSGNPDNDFVIFDITNETEPQAVGSLSLAKIKKDTLTNIFVRGDYAYVTSAKDDTELYIIDITDPITPTVVGNLNLEGTNDALGLYVLGTTIYIVKEGSILENDFFIINASNPNSPELVGSSNIGDGGSALWVNSNYAYISSNESGKNLKVVDITNPAQPSYLIDSFFFSSRSEDQPSTAITGFDSTIFLGSDDGYLYAIDTSDATSINQDSEINNFNLTQPVKEIVLGQQNTVSNSLALVVTNSDMSDELQLIDIRDLNNLTALSSYHFNSNLHYGGFDTRSCKGLVTGQSDQGSEIHLFTAGDFTSPSPITDLSVLNSSSDSVTLTWTAVGDDGVNGQASLYDIRYQTTPITPQNWQSATQVEPINVPNPAGSTESILVANLLPNLTYYFAIKTSDEQPNQSDLSNVISYSTINQSDFLQADSSSVALSPDNKQVLNITLANSGSENITINQIIATWKNDQSGTKIKEVVLNNSSVWSGTASSGALLDITDFTLSPSITYPLTSLTFSKDFKGAILDLTFLMSDATSLTISDIAP